MLQIAGATCCIFEKSRSGPDKKKTRREASFSQFRNPDEAQRNPGASLKELTRLCPVPGLLAVVAAAGALMAPESTRR